MKSRWMPGYSALQLIVVSVVLLLLFVASSLLSPYFATSYNMTIIARSLAFTGLVMLGQAMLMLLGELDISLGAMGGLCGVAAGMLMMDVGINPFAAMGLAIVLGALLGLINGFLVTALSLHSLVLTIAMAGVYKGVNLVLTKGVAITNIPESIRIPRTRRHRPVSDAVSDHAGVARCDGGRRASHAVWPLRVRHRRQRGGGANDWRQGQPHPASVFVIAGSFAALGGTLMVAPAGDCTALDSATPGSCRRSPPRSLAAWRLRVASVRRSAQFSATKSSASSRT